MILWLCKLGNQKRNHDFRFLKYSLQDWIIAKERRKNPLLDSSMTSFSNRDVTWFVQRTGEDRARGLPYWGQEGGKEEGKPKEKEKRKRKKKKKKGKKGKIKESGGHSFEIYTQTPRKTKDQRPKTKDQRLKTEDWRLKRKKKKIPNKISKIHQTQAQKKKKWKQR